jgi:hypothetical protein
VLLVQSVTEQIAELLNALAQIAWPICVLLALVIFRQPVTNLLSKASRVKAAGVELEFQERTQDVLDEISDARLPLTSDEQTVLTELTQNKPRLAMNLAWSRVRDASARAAAAVGVSSQSTVRRIERLARRGFATEEIVSLAKTLKATHTAVMSELDVEPPRDLAEAFTAGALSVAQWFERTASRTGNVAVPPSDYPPSGYPLSDYPPSGYPLSDYPPNEPRTGGPLPLGGEEPTPASTTQEPRGDGTE